MLCSDPFLEVFVAFGVSSALLFIPTQQTIFSKKTILIQWFDVWNIPLCSCGFYAYSLALVTSSEQR